MAEALGVYYRSDCERRIQGAYRSIPNYERNLPPDPRDARFFLLKITFPPLPPQPSEWSGRPGVRSHVGNVNYFFRPGAMVVWRVYRSHFIVRIGCTA